jgi:hypothetical protein
MTNMQTIQRFFDGKFPDQHKEVGSKNLKIAFHHRTGCWGLRNYETFLAEHPIVNTNQGGTRYVNSLGIVYFNPIRYSVTTSKIQTWIRREAASRSIKLVEDLQR